MITQEDGILLIPLVLALSMLSGILMAYKGVSSIWTVIIFYFGKLYIPGPKHRATKESRGRGNKRVLTFLTLAPDRGKIVCLTSGRLDRSQLVKWF